MYSLEDWTFVNSRHKNNLKGTLFALPFPILEILINIYFAGGNIAIAFAVLRSKVQLVADAQEAVGFVAIHGTNGRGES